MPARVRLTVELAAAGASPGHVFVFNMWNEDMAMFSVNGINLGPILGADKSPYTPVNIAVPRVLNMAAGSFANKEPNDVRIQWLGDPIGITLSIKSALTEDLLLYVFPFGYWLVNLSGEIKAQGNFSTDGLA